MTPTEVASVSDKARTHSSDDRIPDEVRERIIKHGERAPYHRNLQQEHEIDYTSIHTWRDLRSRLPLHTDERLRQIDPTDLIPDDHDQSELVRSQSSGTTGEPKEVYWHEAGLEANIEFTLEALQATGVPRGTHWVATTTPNPVLKQTLRGLADRFDSSIDIVEVDPAPVKQALQTQDEAAIADALETIAEQVRRGFHENDVGVYEDIAPSMGYVADTLDADLRERVNLLLIGGVGTTADRVQRLTEDRFPNATLTGWYGDYMNGTSKMREPATLEYVPQEPAITFDVLDMETLSEPVAPGERGAVVSHAIRRGFFVPNRVVGDAARRIVREGTEAIGDIGRLPEEPA